MISPSVPISAIILTKNESENIGRCLQSLAWVNEIIVLDSGSTDATLSIAASFENVRIHTSEWLGYSRTKQLAVNYTSNQWILWLDADEELSPELILEIKQLQIEDKVAFDMPRKTFFLGEWVRHAGWYPGRVIRLFNKEYCKFNDNLLHEGVEPEAGKPTGQLENDILHYSYTSLYQYFNKMNLYGKYGAEELQRKGKTISKSKIILNPIATFFKLYILKRGFLDGTRGLVISAGSAFSNFIKYTNFYYLATKGKVDKF
jgi:(heptosyl)LPS beta-1,4-glucosyltransferase